MNADSPPPTVNIFCGSGVAGARPPVRVTGRVRAGDLAVFGDDRGMTLHAVTPEDGINAVDATARAAADTAGRAAANGLAALTRLRAALAAAPDASSGTLKETRERLNQLVTLLREALAQ